MQGSQPRPDLILADLPGYGYAKISRSISAEWPAFINPYLAERETLAACVCLVDMNVPPQPGDVMLAEYLDSIHRPRIIVGTKADKLSGNQRVVATRRLREASGDGRDSRLLRQGWPRRFLSLESDPWDCRGSEKGNVVTRHNHCSAMVSFEPSPVCRTKVAGD